MNKIKLLTAPVGQLSYLKTRDLIIDKINIEGYDSIVRKTVEGISLWRENKNPYTSRYFKLLSVIHKESELEDIVKESLNYFLKGYKIEKKKIALKGSNPIALMVGGAVIGAAIYYGIEYLMEDTTFTPVVEEDGSVTIYELDEDGNIVSVRNVDDRGSN